MTKPNDFQPTRPAGVDHDFAPTQPMPMPMPMHGESFVVYPSAPAELPRRLQVEPVSLARVTAGVIIAGALLLALLPAMV